MKQAIDLEAITEIHTPSGVYAVKSGSLEVGGLPWIAGVGCYRFNEAKTNRRIMVPVGAVCAVTVKGDGLRDDPERMAPVSPIAGAYDAMAEAPSPFQPPAVVGS